MMERDGEFIKQTNTFTKGMNKDVSLENIPADSYIDATDISILSDGENEILRIGGSRTMGEITLPTFDTNDSYAIYRLNCDVSAAGISHTFMVESPYIAPLSIGITTVGATELDRYNNLLSSFETAINAYFSFTVTMNEVPAYGIPPEYIYFNVTIPDYVYDYKLSSYINSTEITHPSVIIRERFTYGGNPSTEIVGMESIGSELVFLMKKNGKGAVCVAKKDSSGVWASNYLFASKNIPLDSSLVYKIKLEQNNDFISCYWVDGEVTPKTFAFKQETTYTDNSANKWGVNAYTETTNALYTYSSISELTKLQLTPNTSYISYIGCNDEGGVFTTGNKQFAVQYKIGGAYTQFNVISKPISIFERNQSDFYGGGGQPNTITSKSLDIIFSNMRPDLFSQFRLGVIEYSGGATSAYTLGDFDVTGSEFTLTVRGNENKQTLDISTFQDFQPIIKTAHLNEIIENKYFLGRIELATDPDIQDWVENTMFAPSNVEVRAYGLQALNRAEINTPLEFMDFNNIRDSIGYMYDDKYVFGVKFYLKNGLVTKPYYGIELTINNDVTGALGNLTDNVASVVYQYHPRLLSVDFSTAPDLDGVPFLDAVEAFEIVRTDACGIVIDTGIMLQGDEVASTDPYYGTFYTVGGNFTNPSFIPHNPAASQLVGAFISQSLVTDSINLTDGGGKLFRSYGNPQNIQLYFGSITNVNWCVSSWGGYFSGAPAPSDYLVDVGTMAAFNSNAYLDGSRAIGLVAADAATQTKRRASMVSFCYKLSSVATNSSINTNYYGYYAAYINPSAAFGDRTTLKYQSTGYFTLISQGEYTNIDIFGGDTYTQMCYHKTLYNTNPTGSITAYERGAVTYYAQNRFNAQLEYTSELSPISTYPLSNEQATFTDGLADWTLGVGSSPISTTEESRIYDIGFTYSNSIRESKGFDPNETVISKQNTTVYYSDEKLEGELSDPYRVFRAANFKTYEMSDGILTGMYRIRGNLALVQERGLRMQSISPNVTISEQDVAETIIGTGSVFGTKDIPISLFGAQFKTHSILYKSRSGTEYIMWYDNFNKKILRYGIDGVKNISDDNFMRNWVLNNNSRVADEFYVQMAYNPYNDEVLIIGNNPTYPIYSNVTTYNAGDIVSVQTFGGSNLYSTYKSYRALKETTGLAPTQDGTTFDTWEDYRDSNYTLAWNEKFNCFPCFYNIRFRVSSFYGNKMVATVPYTNGSTTGVLLLEGDVSNTGEWISGLSNTPQIEMSTSPIANWTKKYIKAFINMDGQPNRLIAKSDLNTATYMTDFTERRGRWVTPILRNVLEGDLPTDEGKSIFGNILRSKLFFDFDKKLLNFVSVVIPKNRKY